MARLGLQGEEAKMSIEGRSAFVLGIDHHRHRDNLVGMDQAAVQRIREQMFLDSLALGGPIDSQPAQQGDGELWMARRLAGQIFWQVGEVEHRSEEGVVSEQAGVGRVDGDERRGDALVGILSRLLRAAE